MNPGIHAQTPNLTAIDSRGLPVRQVAYWREDASEPEARITARHHDAAGRLVTQRDPRMFADASAPANLTTVYSLTDQALNTQSVDAGWRVSLFGEAHQALHGWDGRGSQRTVEYDEQLRPLALFEHARDGKPLCAERYGYGGSDPAFAARNQCGQLIRHDDPAGTQLFEQFGLTGAVVQQTRHFLSKLEDPDWPALVNERDELLETGIGVTTLWSFSALGEKTQQTDGKGNLQFFRYTLSGQLHEAGVQLKIGITARTLISAIQYNACAQVEKEVMGNGVINAYHYDVEDGRLNRKLSRLGENEPLQDLRYTLDPTGKVTSIEDAALPNRFFANQRIKPINQYRYDSLGQLIAAAGWEAMPASHGPSSLSNNPTAVSHYRQSYRYDTGNNLLELTHVGTQNPGHRLVAHDHRNLCLPVREGVEPDEEDFRRSFDANGNLLTLQPGQGLIWNVRNQLIEVRPVTREGAANDCERYVYRADGMRVRKVRSLKTRSQTNIIETRYLSGLEIHTHSGTAEELHVIVVPTGGGSTRVLHWPDAPPAPITNNQQRYSLTDHLSSSTIELDQNANIISQECYYPFGATAWSDGEAVSVSYKTVRYSGKELDATGLYYYGHRYYVPWCQRWLNPDPAADAAGLNYFRFVEGNPVTNIDPDGLDSERARGLWRFAIDSVLQQREDRDIVTIAPGIIAVALQGNAEVFEQAGIDLSRSFKRDRTLFYLSIDSSYEGRIVGGDEPVRLKTASAAGLNAAISAPDSKWTAYLNGGFYNHGQRASTQAPSWASIGTSFIDGQHKPSVPVPADYADSYVDLRMSNGSFIQTGPLLARDGKPVFTRQHLDEPRFQFDSESNIPGELGHANRPNNRSAISLASEQSDASARTRLVIGIGDSRRSDDSSGFTLPEWAQVMARIDRLNAVPGRSLNLDGGDSSALGVIDQSDVVLMDAGAPGNKGRSTGNFIAFSKKPQ